MRPATNVLAALAVVSALLSASPAGAQAPQMDDALVVEMSTLLVFGGPDENQAALETLSARGDTDIVPSLILAMRYSRLGEGPFAAALTRLTGAEIAGGWNGWMTWMEDHPEIVPHASYLEFKRRLYGVIDPRFGEFLYAGLPHDIRLEEIVWGGVRVDGIPALTNPRHIVGSQADYLEPDEQVFGVEINGDVRAYPLRMMDWHEMFNDVVGGVPVSLAYCTLCGAGILFDTTVDGYDEAFVFGSSGFLYRSNKLMYDQQTKSLWNQFTGRPVTGALVGSGIELAIRPVAITSWRRWLERHPDTKVLSLETGHVRDYRPGRPYGEYFASPDLMFPAVLRDDSLDQKDQVFGVRLPGGAKAWPLDVFAGGAVINDRVGLTELVLVGDLETRTVRAYRREGLDFMAGSAPDRLLADGVEWIVTEDALTAPDGRSLDRLPGHVAFWFAWAGYLRDAELYDPTEAG